MGGVKKGKLLSQIDGLDTMVYMMQLCFVVVLLF
jgi:hypothetical protein